MYPARSADEIVRYWRESSRERSHWQLAGAALSRAGDFFEPTWTLPALHFFTDHDGTACHDYDACATFAFAEEQDETGLDGIVLLELNQLVLLEPVQHYPSTNDVLHEQQR